MRCILVALPPYGAFAVQVVHGDLVLLAERCLNPEDAAFIAERFWNAMIEGRTKPR